MAFRVTVILSLCCSTFALGQSIHPKPTEFEIGRHTFIDVGPPNDFYELFSVRSFPEGSSIERITLTPAADACTQPAKVEVATGTIRESVSELFGDTNPCTIPEKELHRELKRCKKCVVFSGVNVTMQFRCGGQHRIIRADVLDRDMFDPAPGTPEHTSWSMQLLNKMDRVVGPGVIDRPMFAIPEETKQVPTQKSKTLGDTSAGKYDELFRGAPEKPSDLYRAAQINPPVPTVRLMSSTPFQPDVMIQPDYPPLARVAHIEGIVTFTADVSPDGSTANFSVQNGHPMLRSATEKAVSAWKFSTQAAGQRIHVAIEFATNCSARKE